VAIIFTTLLAVGLIVFADLTALGGTTALLLLGVFTIVNIAVLILRRQPVEHRHYRAPTLLPILGAISCAYLASPLSGRDPNQYLLAGVLLLIGIGLWFVNRVVVGRVDFDPTKLPPGEPVN
jgi:amino acid transporter